MATSTRPRLIRPSSRGERTSRRPAPGSSHAVTRIPARTPGPLIDGQGPAILHVVELALFRLVYAEGVALGLDVGHDHVGDLIDVGLEGPLAPERALQDLGQ